MATTPPRPAATRPRKKVVKPDTTDVRPEDRQPLVKPATVSVDDLRASLASGKLSWSVRKDLAPGSPAPRQLLGGDSSSFRRAADAPAADWAAVSAQLPGDVALVQRRLDMGMVPEHLVETAKEIVASHGLSATPVVAVMKKALAGRKKAVAKSVKGGRK